MIDDSLKTENEGDASNVAERMELIGSYLPNFDTATITAREDVVTFEGNTVSKALSQADGEAFVSAFNEGDSVNINVVDPETTATRINIFSGENEYFQGGYWLPATDFDPTLENCDAQTLNVMDGQVINFVTGSAELDASSKTVINRLSGLFNACLEDGTLSLEIGGHTDSDGDDAANLALSQERAAAVLNAIADRGINTENVTAQGYGETQPIAPNTTAEGKKANRRTTFIWSIE